MTLSPISPPYLVSATVSKQPNDNRCRRREPIPFEPVRKKYCVLIRQRSIAAWASAHSLGGQMDRFIRMKKPRIRPLALLRHLADCQPEPQGRCARHEQGRGRGQQRTTGQPCRRPKIHRRNLSFVVTQWRCQTDRHAIEHVNISLFLTTCRQVSFLFGREHFRHHRTPTLLPNLGRIGF